MLYFLSFQLDSNETVFMPRKHVPFLFLFFFFQIKFVTSFDGGHVVGYNYGEVAVSVISTSPCVMIGINSSVSCFSQSMTTLHYKSCQCDIIFRRINRKKNKNNNKRRINTGRMMKKNYCRIEKSVKNKRK